MCATDRSGRGWFRIYILLIMSRHSFVYRQATASLAACLSVPPSVCLSVRPFVCLSLRLGPSAFLSVLLCLLVCPFASPSILQLLPLSVCLSFHPSVFAFPSVCIYVRPFVSASGSVCLSVRSSASFRPSVRLPLSVRLSVCLSVYPSVFASLSVCLSVRPLVFAPPFVCPFASPFIRLLLLLRPSFYLCLCVRLSFCPSVCLSVRPSAFLSIRQSLLLRLPFRPFYLSAVLSISSSLDSRITQTVKVCFKSSINTDNTQYLSLSQIVHEISSFN